MRRAWFNRGCLWFRSGVYCSVRRHGYWYRVMEVWLLQARVPRQVYIKRLNEPKVWAMRGERLVSWWCSSFGICGCFNVSRPPGDHQFEPWNLLMFQRFPPPNDSEHRGGVFAPSGRCRHSPIGPYSLYRGGCNPSASGQTTASVAKTHICGRRVSIAVLFGCVCLCFDRRQWIITSFVGIRSLQARVNCRCHRAFRLDVCHVQMTTEIVEPLLPQAAFADNFTYDASSWYLSR